MKTIKAQQLEGMSATELEKLLKESQEILRQLRFQAKQNELRQVDQVAKARKNIARIKTQLAKTVQEVDKK